MENITSMIIAMIGIIIAAFGIKLKQKGKKANIEIKKDSRYENYMKKADFIRNFGIILSLTMMSIIFLPIYFGYVGFGILVIYILSYSLHISTGESYSKILPIELIIIALMAFSIYMFTKN